MNVQIPVHVYLKEYVFKALPWFIQLPIRYWIGSSLQITIIGIIKSIHKFSQLRNLSFF